MKKTLRLVLCVMGFILIAAPTAVEYYPVYLNGKPLGNAVALKGGVIAISLEDFAKAGGAGPTLEPSFRIQGNTLIGVVAPTDSSALKHKMGNGAQGSQAPMQHKEQGKLLPAVQTPYKEQATFKFAPGQQFRIQNSGPISQRLIREGGKVFIPVEDVAKAFGDGSVRQLNGGTLKPGEAIRINFRVNPNGILIGL